MAANPVIPEGWEIESGGPTIPDGWEIERSEPLSGSRSNPRRYTNPNRGKSSLELAGRGSFNFLNDVSLARRQMMNDVAGLFGADVADEQNRLEGIADARKLDPVMDTTAGQIGYGATAAVPAVAASMAAPGYGGAALGGAGLGLFQPTGTNDSRITNTAVSTGASLLGQGAANLVGRVAQPVKSGLNKAETRAIQYLKEKGVSLSTGQQTGSRAAQAVERTLGDIPSSAPTMARQGDKFRDSFTRAVLRTAGVNAVGATP
jgi:hypothetical protein